MKITIFGTGVVGKTLANKLIEKSHEVAIGTRNIEESKKRLGTDQYGNPDIGAWLNENPSIKLMNFKDASEFGEIVINATNGMGSLESLKQTGNNLNEKILIDIANPLDFSKGMPPSLYVSNTDSLGEQIQRQFPKIKVVKTLNTLNATLMANPQLLAKGDHTIFVSGNDEDAKATVTKYLQEWFDWKLESIIDLGDITTARGTEMLLPIWVRLFTKLQNPMFNFKLVTDNGA